MEGPYSQYESMSQPQRQRRRRLAGIGLYVIAIGLIVWQSVRYSARLDEVDAGAGYLEPLDFVLIGITIACVVVAFMIHRRLD